MNIAILGFSIIGAVTGTASLLIMSRTAKELQTAKRQVDGEIEDVRNKIKHNAKIVKTALSALEL